MWKQWLLALLIVIVAIAGGLAWQQLSVGEPAGQAREYPATPVAVVQPEWDQVRDVIRTVGSLKASQAVELTTEVSGRVVEVRLGAGRKVAEGELLVRLDERQARADLAEIEARLADARRQLERATQLRSRNSVSQSQVDELRTAVDVALAQRQAAQVRLENHSIRAPFAGVVGLSDITVGTYVTAGTSITTLDATEEMELAFSIPEKFLGQVYPGQEVHGESPAYPERLFHGRLAELGSRVDELSRTLPVRALIDNHEGLLRPGQFMSATLTLEQRQALVIPEQALLVRGGDHYVFVVQDGRAHRLAVEQGARMPGRVEVVSGLQPEDQVIVTGQERLSSGDPVRVLEGEPVLPQNRFLNGLES